MASAAAARRRGGGGAGLALACLAAIVAATLTAQSHGELSSAFSSLTIRASCPAFAHSRLEFGLRRACEGDVHTSCCTACWPLTGAAAVLSSSPLPAQGNKRSLRRPTRSTCSRSTRTLRPRLLRRTRAPTRRSCSCSPTASASTTGAAPRPGSSSRRCRPRRARRASACSASPSSSWAAPSPRPAAPSSPRAWARSSGPSVSRWRVGEGPRRRQGGRGRGRTAAPRGAAGPCDREGVGRGGRAGGKASAPAGVGVHGCVFLPEYAAG